MAEVLKNTSKYRKLIFLLIITFQQFSYCNVYSKPLTAFSENTFSILSMNIKDIEIYGKIVDEKGNPIIGANVHVKNTKIGVTSDLDGNYILMNVPANANLEISFTGYLSQMIAVNGRTNINITLKINENKLDEVVIIGYASQKKSDVLGAVSSVNIKAFDKSVSPFASQSLQGLVSGVRVTSNTGAPGEGARIRIRGVGSLTGNNTPLYIVDGVPTQNAMDNISPLDIENISVLKDAASSAIYGARANNGVVIITTRKGKKGQEAKITFSSLLGVQSHGKLTKMTNKDQYIQLYNEAADNDNALLPIDQLILFRKKISPEYASTLPNVNQLESVFRDAPMQQYHIGFSGGTDKTTYNISGGYFNQAGIMLGSSYEKYTGKISLNTEVESWFNVGVNLSVYNDKNNIVGSSGDGYGGNGGSAIRYAFFRTPAIPIYDANGGYVDLPEKPNFFGDGYNPVGLLNNQDNVGINNGVFGDVNLKLKFSNDLFLVSTLGLDRSNYKQTRFNKTWGTNNRINNPNSLNVNANLVSNLSMSNVLNYSHSFKENHNFSGLLGTESIDNNAESMGASDRIFVDQNKVLVKLGNGTGIKTANESMDESKLLSYFGKVNYNYDEKYFASALMRRDGSSRFKAGNRWGTFYSTSLGWRIDKDFLKNSSLIDKWMLRLGYGSVGDQQISNFAYSSLIANYFNYPFGGISQPGSAMVSMGNESLKWATSNQIDIGTDISFFKGKLDFTLDYYNKTTQNMLLQISIPSSNGYAGAPIYNSGKVLNRGYELDVTYRNNPSNDFGYTIKANASLLHNEVLELNSPILAGRIDNSIYATKTEVGYPIGSFFLYEQEGIFQNATDVFTHAFQGNNILPGDVKYKDLNSDGVINDLDRKHFGSPIPKVTFGLNTDIIYKNFDLSVFFAGAYGQEIYYQIATDIEGFYRPFNVTQRYFDERWTGEGTSNTQPRASWNAKSNNTKPSTRFLEDGSYVRLKNIQLGYNFSADLIQKLKIAKLRIYVSASNLLTFSKYPGLDPEFSTNDNSKSEGDLAAGIDFGTYPNAVVIASGLQITF